MIDHIIAFALFLRLIERIVNIENLPAGIAEHIRYALLNQSLDYDFRSVHLYNHAFPVSVNLLEIIVFPHLFVNISAYWVFS